MLDITVIFQGWQRRRRGKHVSLHACCNKFRHQFMRCEYKHTAKNLIHTSSLSIAREYNVHISKMQIRVKVHTKLKCLSEHCLSILLSSGLLDPDLARLLSHCRQHQ